MQRQGKVGGSGGVWQSKGFKKGYFREKVISFIQLGQFAGDIVSNPVAVPPFCGINENAAYHDTKMKVISTGKSGLTCQPYDMTFCDLAVQRYVYPAQMRVNGGKSLSVIKDHCKAVYPHMIRKDDAAVIGRLDFGVLLRGQIHTHVYLLVDFFPLVVV
jgi:hypothetical protein